MKDILLALVMLFAACVPAVAQTSVTGTWRVEVPDEANPWELVLKANGTSLTGKVNSCNSVQVTIEIFDGRIDGNTITFKCLSGDGQRTVSLTGRINGDEIAFTWDKRDVGNGTRGTTGLFAPSAPHQFTARRVAGTDIAKVPADVHGRDFVAAVNLVPRDLRATASLFLPPRITRVRANTQGRNNGATIAAAT
jgi:hypothetical protein